MVKEFEDPADDTLYLVFNATHIWGEGKETTLEYGIKVMASVADYAWRHQIPVRVFGGGLRDTQPGPKVSGAPRAAFSGPPLLENLALVVPGDSLGLSETLAQLPPGSSALVAVSAADTEGVQAIVQVAPKLHRLVVVAFEGFGEPTTDGEALKPLQLARIPVARCTKGKLGEALQALASLNGPSFLTQIPSASPGTGGQTHQSSASGNGSTGPVAGVSSEWQLP
jgi:uncharacterized protein (DUF58 family)